MPTIVTQSRQKSFTYERDGSGDLVLHYGNGYKIKVSADQFQRLIAIFKGKKILLGPSRDNAPAGSLGDWLLTNVTKTAIASYIGPILVNEGLAHWAPPQGKALAITIL